VHPRGACSRLVWIFQALPARRHDFYLVNVGLLDRLGHQFGPRSDEISVALGEVGTFVKHVYKSARRAFGDKWYFLLASDHGMTPVERSVDIPASVTATGIRQPADFIALMDGTCARFRFENADAERSVRETVSALAGLRVLGDDDYVRLHLPLRRDVVGDLLILADSGVLFSPSISIQQAVTSLNLPLPRPSRCSSARPLSRAGEAMRAKWTTPRRC